MQELISYFYKGILKFLYFTDFILCSKYIVNTFARANILLDAEFLYNTKGPARRPVLLRIVCSLLYEVYHDELERVHLVLGLTVSSGKRCAPVLSFEELSRLF